MRNRRTVWVGAVVAALVAATSACGGDSDEGQGVTPAGESSSLAPDLATGGYGAGAGADQAGAPSRSGPAGTLVLREDAKLGEIVTDSAGWTLYRFENDTAKPPSSNCDGDCAKAWPPVPADDAAAAGGMDPELLGKVKRSDGTSQLTLGGWPVYRYAQDTTPGDTKGQGVGGNWNVLAADGGKASVQDSGGSSDDTPGAGEADDDDAGSAPAGGGPAGGDEQTQLSAVKDPALGTIVADAQGRTLYRFDKDTAWPMKSNCEGECLKTWKPAKPVDKAALKGIDPKMISTLKRSDGSRQLAIDCWPVYWFTGDKKAGDTTGHGAGGVWWAVTPDGKKANGGAPADS
ncbi:SCO0930 family lipoprotein [Streptomyces alkaliterrae]|uniref:Lipoprotein n=1 Tax=Streptomyces alkaliterrae TaxID=2213162 RepID=A0A5P0YW17_9ACTN|nr:SCO0930 family lipoprotein [Streptomyces alkaliterrae]MBB1258945.1 hypothetical protein [Streptomyces alkaliterrae]MQS02669.1 hypothetical protein [Streptomyces alkaliterrae]